MNNVVSQRFIECIEALKAGNRIKSARQFALSLDYLPQGLSEIFKGRRDVTIELIRKAVEVYGINPSYLFQGQGRKFHDGDTSEKVNVLAIVTDQDNRERIVHVPVPAQAGYASQFNDPVFVKSLPTYSLPDYNFQSGSYRSFDVAGDSMLPTLHSGDRVVCSFIEPNYWYQAVKDRQMHVIISTTDVLVKRIVNNIRTEKSLVLQSDNQEYPEIVVPIEEVQEIWKVRLKISPYLDPPMGQHIDAHMKQQSQLIEKLHIQLESLIQSTVPMHG